MQVKRIKSLSELLTESTFNWEVFESFHSYERLKSMGFTIHVNERAFDRKYKIEGTSPALTFELKWQFLEGDQKLLAKTREANPNDVCIKYEINKNSSIRKWINIAGLSDRIISANNGSLEDIEVLAECLDKVSSSVYTLEETLEHVGIYFRKDITDDHHNGDFLFNRNLETAVQDLW